MTQFAVIGLGRFGSSAALELMKLGHDVLGIDSNRKLVSKYADSLTQAVIADATDEQALAELSLQDYDVVLVAIGTDLQTSLLCVVHLKSLGIKNIWVKASSHPQHLILNRLGVDRIIHPEEEMGMRTAQALSYPMVEDYISLGNGQFIVEIHVSDQLQGAPIESFMNNLPSPIYVIAVKRRSELLIQPEVSFSLAAKDILVLLGSLTALKTLAPRLA
ncbi:MAG TPA: TrkA family potassium uptake protein [Burkholderiaceae bacterium]|nr:TrkA family potassium uptake protein [Burkholderiaceae bacterium]